jgi:DNA-binding IclR family transcriptional regulator
VVSNQESSGAVSSVKSADRVLTLLELLGREGDGLPHVVIAEKLGIPKGSLTPLLRNLVTRQWLDYSPATRTYALGPIILSLSRNAARAADLILLAQPILDSLTGTTHETSAINVRKGDEAEVVATKLSPQRLISMMRLGDRSPLYATSSGKVILACMPDDELEAYLKRVRLQHITSKTITSITALRKEIQAVRTAGFARSQEEFTPGVIGLAVPVYVAASEFAGAISVALPISRYKVDSESKLVSLVRTHAAAFARAPAK